MSDFVRYKLGFNTAGFMKDFEQILDIAVNWLSDRVVELFQSEIWNNSEASKVMKSDARKAVREISRKLVSGILELEVGVDEDFAKSAGVQFYIRTMVSIYGNLDQGAIVTKPGQYTWRKNVTDYHKNVFSKKVKRIKPFEQKGHSKAIVKGVLKNIGDRSNKYINDFLTMIDTSVSGAMFERYITVS